MRWDLTLERRTRNRLNPENARKKLRAIAAVAERNKVMGCSGRVGKWHEPEMGDGDGGGGEQVWRYRARLRLETVNVLSTEGAKVQCARVLKTVTRRAAREGWTVLTPDPVSVDT